MDGRLIRTLLRSMAVTAAAMLLGVAVIVSGASTAFAGVGRTFMKFPDFVGAWPDGTYKGWVRIDARDWQNVPFRERITLGLGNPYYSGPAAPLPGSPNKLAIALDKKNPDLAHLMAMCTNKTSIPEITFAEPPNNRRPEFPPFLEYKLVDAQIQDCDVVPDAPEQAFIIDFKDIVWLNYDAKGPLGVEAHNTAADIPNLKPEPASAKTKTFLITWFGWATLGDDDTCPKMNSKPPQEDYYALLSPEEAAAERAKRGEKGVSFGNSPDRPFMDARGPHRLNVCAMPGIVRSPDYAEPQTTKALGVNLDGDDGSGAPPAGTCKHQNFVSEDGSLTGVDNQLFRVFGCVPGYRGKKGYMNQTHNARRADGNVVTLIQITGIDNPMNDDNVEISIFYAQDKPVRSASGQFVPNYTFRMTNDPNFARYNSRVRGRIVNGYVVTPPIKKWEFNNGQGGIVNLNDAQLRLHIEPDGNLKGVAGGYIDWHGLAAAGSSYQEGLFNFSCPGMWASFKRNADGMKDPVTGECNGISMAYEIDAVPAFITPAGPKESKGTKVADNRDEQKTR